MKKQTPQARLETAYWLNWCGEKDYARRILIQIADEVLGRYGNEPKVSYHEQKKAKEVEENERDEYLIR